MGDVSCCCCCRREHLGPVGRVVGGTPPVDAGEMSCCPSRPSLLESRRSNVGLVGAKRVGWSGERGFGRVEEGGDGREEESA